MTQALVLAWADSVNVLLIGVILALGVSLKRKYVAVASLLIAGDWLGVFLLALGTLLVFDGLQDVVSALVRSPVFGWALIAIGVVAACMAAKTAWDRQRGKPPGSNGLVHRILGGLRRPSAKTVATGFVLGVVQSATSGPFFGGLLVLSASGIPTLARYVGLLGYATVALSLPALSAVLVGMVRRYPHSRLGRGFTWMRTHPQEVTIAAGMIVAVVLVGMGAAHL